MKFLNRIDGSKTRPQDLMVLAGAVIIYGVGMAIAAGRALLGSEGAAQIEDGRADKDE